jgi:hypothetical protein
MYDLPGAWLIINTHKNSQLSELSGYPRLGIRETSRLYLISASIALGEKP